ncbi:MAG: Aminodeoxyfutalosine deaminase, partial [Verrucomicrobia bacterium]|nr:Aminodeoxyfutalosine deaminase [Verrucomicrobiota bacterium]
MLLRARILLPVTAPPIENGGILIRDGRIAAAGRWPEICAQATGDEIVDLGNVVLMPGLVNAHAHLEYTGMAGQFTGANGFAEWVRSINASKQRNFTHDTATEQWLTGAAMLMDSGTTTVADVQTRAGAAMAESKLTALRIIPFIEMTGVISRKAPEDLIGEADSLLEPYGGKGGYSPHSPYATTPGLLELTALRARESGRVTTIHVAESNEEFEMFVHRRGPLYEMIAALGRPMEDCDGRTPLQHVDKCELLQKNTLLVHANYLTDEDVALIGGSSASVVHCPGSHAFFDHEAFRYQELKQCGVNLCLGTDSLATLSSDNGHPPELNMMSELRRFRLKHMDVLAREVLAMATVNGARALGLERDCGSLRPGTRADLIAISYG